MDAHAELVTLVGSYLLVKKKKEAAIERPRFTSNFAVQFMELRECEKKFLDYFHVTINTFDELFCRVKPKIIYSSYRDTLSPVHRLALTLRYFAEGCSLSTFHQMFNVPLTTTNVMVMNVSSVIWETLKVKTMSRIAKWKCTAAAFEKRVQFPNCIGAIIMKRIYVKPSRNASANYLDLFAICDTDYKFIHLFFDNEDPRVHNDYHSRHFWISKLQQNKSTIPDSKLLPNTNTDPAPYVFVSDNSHKSPERILTPYTLVNDSYRNRVFDCRLKQALRYAETAMEMFINRFRIFHQPMAVSIDKAKIIIKACGAVHNLIMSRTDCQEDDMVIDPRPSDVTNEHQFETEVVSENPTRDIFADYFVSDAGITEIQEDANAMEVNPVEANPIKLNPVKTTPMEVNPVEATPVEANPVEANPVKAIPMEVNPVKTNPVEATPVKVNPIKVNPIKVNLIKVNPVKVNLVKAIPMEVNPVKANPVEANPVKVIPIKINLVKVNPVKVNPVKAIPMEVNPVEVNPVGTNTVEAKCVEANSVEAKRVEANPVEAKRMEANPVGIRQDERKPAEIIIKYQIRRPFDFFVKK